jgi:hypothetical protein
MFLLTYEISGKTDVHGLRMRLIYALRKQDAIQLMKSAWLITSPEPPLQKVIEECISQGYPILLSEWSPLDLQARIRTQQASFTDLLVGLVIHSPEVIELGTAKELLERLERDNLQYRALLGGVMGRLAILDAHLEEKVFINHPYKPSEAIDYLIKRNVDLIVLLNQGISEESGAEFGRQVVENSKLQSFFNIPIIQLDRLRDNDAFLIWWTPPLPIFQMWLHTNYPVKEIIPLPHQEIFKTDGEFTRRFLRAVQTGDKILVNGVVVGEVTSNFIEIVSRSSLIYDIIGGIKEAHGIEKLGPVDLKSARITTLKSLRRVSLSEKRKISPPKSKTNIAMLTWRGEKVYFQADKIDCLVSIGDDTTFVATEIMARFSHPIIGIFDGDADGILYETTELSQLLEIAPPHSLFIQVQPGKDDIVGHLIEQQIFKNRTKIKYTNLDAFKNQILTIAKDLIVNNG